MNKRVLILATGESGDNQITSLQSPVPDGERLRDLLVREDVGGYDVRLVPNPSLVIAGMEIEDFFGQAKADDTLILLITGHGMRDDGMRLFFATADSRHNKVRSTSLAARFVLEERDRSLAARKILMFDTCHAGSYAKGHYNDKSGQSGFLPEDFDTSTEGTAVLTASSARQSAREAEVDGVYQSHFTRLLIEGIQTGAADPEGTGEITLDRLFAYLRSGLRRDSPGQTPSIEMKGALGSFVIARNPVWQKPQLPEELQEAVASTNRIARCGAVPELVFLVSSRAREAEGAKEALLTLLRDRDATVGQTVVQACKRHGVDIAGLYVSNLGEVALARAEPVQAVAHSAPAGRFAVISSVAFSSSSAAVFDEPAKTAPILRREMPVAKWYRNPLIVLLLVSVLTAVFVIAQDIYENQKQGERQLAQNIAAQKLAEREFPGAIGGWRKSTGTDSDCNALSSDYLELSFSAPLLGLSDVAKKQVSIHGSKWLNYVSSRANNVTAGGKEFHFIKNVQKLYVRSIGESTHPEEYVRCP